MNMTTGSPAAELAGLPASIGESAWRVHPSRRSVVVAVGRRLVPHLIEATVIPTVLFYVLLFTLDLRWAFVAALAWSYTAIGRRLAGRRRIPPLLLLASLGITTRTVIFLSSSSSFVYFLQPILGTLVTATVFAGSVLIGRPLIARFAADFCPLAADVECRPAIVQLFRRLTYLWAGVNVVIAAVSLTLLLTVPVAVFVATKMVAAWATVVTGVVVTVCLSVRTARSEGLTTAVSPSGTLHAFVVAPATG